LAEIDIDRDVGFLFSSFDEKVASQNTKYCLLSFLKGKAKKPDEKKRLKGQANLTGLSSAHCRSLVKYQSH